MGPVALREPRGRMVGARHRRRGASRGPRAFRSRLQLGRTGLPLPACLCGDELPHHRAGGEMTTTAEADVVLVYPQRAPAQGRHWIMPSLGLMYLSASLRRAGYSVRHIDHTFLERHEVLDEIERLQPSV